MSLETPDELDSVPKPTKRTGTTTQKISWQHVERVRRFRKHHDETFDILLGRVLDLAEDLMMRKIRAWENKYARPYTGKFVGFKRE